MATDLQSEQNQLHSQLKQFNDKISSWLTDEVKLLDHSQDQRQERLRQQGKEEMTKVKAFIATSGKEQGQKLQALEEKNGVLEELQRELERLHQQACDLKASKQQGHAAAEGVRSDIHKVKQEIEAPNKDKQKLEYLHKASTVFGDMLGLTFKKTRGNRVQVIFTHIDETDPSMPYFFFLQIQGAGRKYIVTDCEPNVDGVEMLVTRLNETNNFRAFMMAMRNKFKETLTK